MATIALSLAGQFAGGLIGGPFGAAIGRAVGAMAGSVVDGMIFGDKPKAAANDIRLQGSSEGGAIPRLYGWSRLSGNIIWARELELLDEDGRGAKGISPPREEQVGASFAVAFCEGEVARLGRIWADGQLLDTQGLTLRFYRGSESQLPDGLIEATQGVAPAYRGLCYLVVEQLPLGKFGNRIPQLTVELCRVVGDLERDIRAVTVIPGASEFGYDPTPRVQVLGRGQSKSENTHQARGESDWTCSIDELVALCPKLEHVALVVAWFGDDLRCGNCVISPRVESAVREVPGAEWRVAGLGRNAVPVMSRHNGGPAYGGTPSDSAVLAAIADLRARGLKVTLYPLIMMDVPDGNVLPDPYSASAGQGAYPWRGRITCHPAPERAGSPDRSGVAAAQVAAFVAGGYRQMILHYAGIARQGGAEALLIGSEMVGLSTVRGAGNSFPFVDALVALAGEVRAIVGTATKLSYAADWSEYSGYQVAGEKFFHLDPLWASPDIDAVGIDNYMPLADWRDGSGHLDAAISGSGYDLDYLTGNIAGGEGFEWYYASAADRLAQVRTPITDGAHGEPWVWRYKDIRGWWSHWHHNRPNGVRSATPTAWVPGSKPIWLTELGCGAVDKGANQPNIFGDEKSSESGRPYFSSGLPDALIQRQFLRAHQAYWRDQANNPAGMLDISRMYLWTWDARPYPAFPAQTDVWADGPNHRMGHWLTGRLGGAASDELLQAIARDHGVEITAEAAAPFVTGYALGNATTAREALEPVLEITGLSLRNRRDGLEAGAARRPEVVPVQPDDLVLDEAAVLARRRGDSKEAPGRLALSYLERERDYLVATVTALARAEGPLAGEASSLVLDAASARLAAERLLDARGAGRETLDFALPPALLALEPGDLIGIAGQAEGPFEIGEIRDGLTRRVTARSLPNPTAVATPVDRAVSTVRGNFAQAVPVVLTAHLPPTPDDPARTRLAVAGFSQPWPGNLRLTDATTGAAIVDLERRAAVGETTAALGSGPEGIWDTATLLEVSLLSGHPASADPLAVLAGSNRIAVQTDVGDWEIIGFAEAELIAVGRYRLRRLLRGLDGTGAAMGPVSVGRSVVLLDARARMLPVDAHLLGESRTMLAYAGSHDLTGTPVVAATARSPALPLSPVHLRARREAGGAVQLSWVRRSRADGDGWGAGEAPLEHRPEAYAVTVTGGRTLTVGTPGCVYGAAEQTADFGGLPTQFQFGVAQLSPVLGAGHVAWGEFHG